MPTLQRQQQQQQQEEERLLLGSSFSTLRHRRSPLRPPYSQQQQQQQQQQILHEDEGVSQLSLDLIAAARPFIPSGVCTPQNTAKPADGAAALVLGDEETAEKRGLKPIAR